MRRIHITILSFLTLITTAFSAYSDSGKLMLSGGVMTGGPILTENMRGGYGKPGFSFHTGLNYEYELHQKWSVRTGLHFQFKQLDYGQKVRRDTIVEIEFQGIKGKVPSYYYADAKGKMLYATLEIPLTVNFALSDRFYLFTGLYGAYHPYISDKGNVHVQIGEGGIIEDENESFENSDYQRDFDFGFKLGAGIKIVRSFSIEFYGQRGFISVFKPGSSPSYDVHNLRAYQTYGLLSLVYTPWRF